MNLFRRFLLPLLLIVPLPAYAWGPEGHEVIARIAADNLSPAAHLRISQLLGGDAPALMVLDSNWADEIRADRPETTNWHFVNIEIGSKGYNAGRDCARDDCVVAQIGRDAAILRDPKTSHAAKLDALRFLIHFVGDLHQPLHAADRHDKGGNNLIVLLGKRRTNLHHVWDEELVKRSVLMSIKSPAASKRDSRRRTKPDSRPARPPIGPMKVSLWRQKRFMRACRRADRSGCRVTMPIEKKPRCACNWRAPAFAWQRC